MELQFLIKYALIFPAVSYGPEYDIDKVLTPVELIFRLTTDFVPYPDGYKESNKHRYQCQSCLAYTNNDWKTSEFRVYSSKTIPEFVQEEIQQHVKDHQTLGEWGIRWYRREIA